MRVLRTIAELRAARRPEGSIGLVPTMGALHEGHLSLIRRARGDCAQVVLSVFVNPTQFAPGEDLDAYPRRESADAALAEQAGADILFAPAPSEIYPPGFATTVSVAGVSSGLCGAERGPEHFTGVATVVTKLLNIVGPDVAYFGQKDAQQCVVLERLVADLNIPVRIEVCPTVRESDGLALSSRNAYLAPHERERALGLSRALRAAEQAVAGGEQSATAVRALARGQLQRHGVEPEYVELVDPRTLQPVERVERPVLLALAARVGRARLIDNQIIQPGR
ncbi:MAG: pantoate--beta-alanine ligase [Solirubrobacteraceae bacterium]